MFTFQHFPPQEFPGRFAVEIESVSNMATSCRLATKPPQKSQFHQEKLPIHPLVFSLSLSLPSSISGFILLLQCGVSTVIAQQQEELFSLVTHLDLPLSVLVCSVLSRKKLRMVADRIAKKMSKEIEVDGELIYAWLVYIYLWPQHNQYLFLNCLQPVYQTTCGKHVSSINTIGDLAKNW